MTLLGFYNISKFILMNNSIVKTFQGIRFIGITEINKKMKIAGIVHRNNSIHPNRRFIVTGNLFGTSASFANRTLVLFKNLAAFFTLRACSDLMISKEKSLA